MTTFDEKDPRSEAERRGENVIPLAPQFQDPREIERNARRQIKGGEVERARRRNRILELKAAGLTVDEIAVAVEMSPTSVSRIVNTQLQEWRDQDAENIEAVRAMKLYELDQLKKAVWGKALKGDLRAVREARNIIQQQARISGAEAPRQIETTQRVGLAGIDPAEIDRMERAWLETRPDADHVVDAHVVDEQLPLLQEENTPLDQLGN